MALRLGLVLVTLLACAGCSLLYSPSELTRDEGPAPSSSAGAAGSGGRAGAYAGAVLASQPMAYYHFDEAEGSSAVDASGNGNDCEYGSAVVRGVDGPAVGGGRALHFSGIENSFVNCHDVFNYVGRAAVAFEFWIRIKSYAFDNYYRRVFSREGTNGTSAHGYALLTNSQGNAPQHEIAFQRIDSSGGPQAYSGAYFDGATLLDPPGWHHFVVTYNGMTIAFYRDGVHVSQPDGTSDTSIARLDGSFAIGAGSPNVGGPSIGFIGDLDEFAVYDRALNDVDVAGHFAAASSGP